MRVGLGFDMHRLVEGRRLILGGVDIPFPKGLDGHSDADVLTHSIIDALLGAAGEGDIGQRFGVEDPRCLGISSLALLKEVSGLLRFKGLAVENVDATLVAQEPRLAHYLEVMEKNIALALGVDSGRVNVKATTPKGLGPIGAGEGIACHAIACLSFPSTL